MDKNDSQKSSTNGSHKRDDSSLLSQDKSPAGYGDRQAIQQQEKGGHLGDAHSNDERKGPADPPSQSEQSEGSDQRKNGDS